MKNDSAHLIGKLEGITAQDLEWSVTGTADYSDINMGHLGFEWQQSQYDLSFEANQPLGQRHRLSFGLSARHTDLQVRSEAVAPFSLPSLTEVMNPFSSVAGIPILDYDQRFTSFNRFNAYLQDSIDLSNELLLSVGAKLEENDFAGFGFQPGSRLSWMVNDLNVLWAAYSKAHRQPSLRERYITLSPLRYWVADLPVAYPTKWVNKAYAGDESLDREEMDAYELGWRLRPTRISFELSVYQYDTQNAAAGRLAPVRSMPIRPKTPKLMAASFRLTGGFRNHGVSGADILRRKEKSRVSGFMIFRKTPPACRLISGIRIK